MYRKSFLVLILTLIVVMTACVLPIESYQIVERGNFTSEHWQEGDVHSIITKENMMLLMSGNDSGYSIEAVDLETMESLVYLEYLATEYSIYSCDASGEYFGCLVKNHVQNTIEVLVYSVFLDVTWTNFVSDNPNYTGYESSIQIERDRVLVRLTTGYQGEGSVFLLDILGQDNPILVDSYSVTTYIMDASLQALYGNSDQFISDSIILNSKDYLDTTRSIGVFSASTGERQQTLEIFDDTDTKCDMYGSSIMNPFVFVKGVCPGDIHRFMVYDFESHETLIDTEYDDDLSDYRLRGVNQDYVYITNSNYVKYDGANILFDFSSNEYFELPSPKADMSFFGSISFLYEDKLVLISAESPSLIYVFNISTRQYESTQEEYEVRHILGMCGGFLLIEANINLTRNFVAYDIETDTYIVLSEIPGLISQYGLTNQYIVTLTDEENGVFDIFERIPL